MDEYILCECVLEKNKLLMIFGGQHNVGTIPLSIAKRTIVQLTIRAAWVQSSLWEGKRDSPMICWKGGKLGYYILYHLVLYLCQKLFKCSLCSFFSAMTN